MFKHCDEMRYKRDRNYQLGIQLLASLAFLPEEEIEPAFEEIELHFDEDLEEFLNYYVQIVDSIK